MPLQLRTVYEVRVNDDCFSSDALSVVKILTKIHMQKLCSFGMICSVKNALEHCQDEPQKTTVPCWLIMKSVGPGLAISFAKVDRRESKSAMDDRFAELKQQYPEGSVPTPEFWGGYQITATEIEFWQGRANRLHDRIVYVKATDSDQWHITRLLP